MTTQKHDAMPIYVSYLTFGNFLDWLKEMTVVPSQIDRSLWSAKFSGGYGAQLMVGLRFLGLLDGERPTPALEPLAMADDVERKELLRAVLEHAYGEDIIRDLPRMTPGMLDKKLEELGTTPPTHRKAVSYFVNASKAVGLAVPAQIARKARNKPVPSKPSAGKSNVKPEKKQKPFNETPEPPGDNDGGGGSDIELPVASRSLMLWGLFQALPIPGEVFDKAEQERWIGAAKAIFAVEYKAEDSSTPNAASTPV